MKTQKNETPEAEGAIHVKHWVARLNAAAPELLAALRNALLMTERFHDETALELKTCNDAITASGLRRKRALIASYRNAARSAIAKAEGRE